MAEIGIFSWVGSQKQMKGATIGGDAANWAVPYALLCTNASGAHGALFLE